MNALYPVAIAVAATGLALPADAQKLPADVKREFTAEEYVEYNAALAAGGEPGTTAARLLKGYVPLYPISRALSGVSGACVLQFAVDARGQVAEITRVREDDRRMCDHAVIAMRRWQFQPAARDGKPVASRYRVPITYSFR